MKLNELNNVPELLVLVGLPASGKSTWVKNFLSSTKKEFVIVSTDDILEKMAIDNNSNYNDMHNSNYKNAEKEMNQIATSAFSNRKNIIWDQTNLSSNKRRKILSRCPKEYNKVAVVFEVDDNELYKRLNTRELETGKRISPNVISQLKGSYSPVSNTEGFDKIIRV